MLKSDDRSEAVVGFLRQRGVVDDTAVDRARRAAVAESIRLDLALAKLGLAPEAELALAYASTLGCALVEPVDFPNTAPQGVDLPESYLKRARILPLSVEGRRLEIAMADPLDRGQIRAIAVKTGMDVVPRPARPADLDAALERLYSRQPAGDGGPADRTDIEKLRSIASGAPVVQFVDRMLAAAVERRASDIHLVPSRAGLRVRFRVDGSLQDAETPPTDLKAAILSRLKLMAKLDIAETRLPQDGRIQAVLRGREFDMRVSVAPTIDGESIVVRVLDGGGARPDLTKLGLSREILAPLTGLLDRPHGVTIVTGPTGSGKTTTLYAALARLSQPDRHIATIEDPVEYRLEGINQIQVRPDIGFDFADALRHLLRHDPDVVMIGEIRDGETAQIGLQSALTGHPVLATLHTNDAVSAIPRLLDMGAEAFLVAAVMNGAVAQRLVRRLCMLCRQPVAVPDNIVPALERYDIAARDVHAPGGCEACRGTGYHGRTVIAEILVVDERIRRLIRSEPDIDTLRGAAVDGGMRPIHADGLAKVANGETSLDELIRAAGRVPV